ncbi:MAG TPA: O-antigen ligase family protein [Bryobacteraceae bacterium]|nr:O-antigen ligase family protein [Bryobacteraceae bacterium]
MSSVAFYTAFASAAAILFSIAVSNILMALSLAALLLSGDKLRMPPIKLPLALFLLGTVLSLALSDSPWDGRVQIRKFWVFLILLVIYSTFRNARQVRWLFLTFAVLGTGSALRALSQLAWQLKDCAGSYGCLIGERITGFMSHWMTFGGQAMIVLLLLSAFLFWAEPPRKPLFAWAVCGTIIAAAIFAGGTRSIWLATAVAGSYLLYCWKRWVVLIGPVVIAIALLAAPTFLKQRFTSAWKPQGELDSNAHRRVSWRTGFRMIQAHPVFGIGPEHVKLQFKQYMPPDVTRLPDGYYGHLHNIYLDIAAERGIPTLLVFLWMLGVMLRDFAKALRRQPPGPGDTKFILQGAIAVVLAILIGGIFEKNLGDTEVLVLFLATISCAYVAICHEPDTQRA